MLWWQLLDVLGFGLEFFGLGFGPKSLALFWAVSLSFCSWSRFSCKSLALNVMSLPWPWPWPQTQLLLL